MKIKYIVLCAGISLLFWSMLFLFVLKKDLTVGLYKDFFTLKTQCAEKYSSPRFFIIAGSNGLYSHDAETFEKKLGVPAVNLSMVAMFSLAYLFERYKPLMRSGDIVYLPLEYDNYASKDIENSFGNIYDITIEKKFRKLNLKSFYNCFGSFDLHSVIESCVESVLTLKGFKRRVSIEELTPRGDFAANTRELSKPYESFLNSLPRRTFNYTKPVAGLIEFLQWAYENKVTVIGGLAVFFEDAVFPDDTQNKIEKFFTDHKALFVITPNRSLYPRSCFFDTHYHLQREIQIQHSALTAEAMLKKYPALFSAVKKQK